jgi:hypothetical protein
MSPAVPEPMSPRKRSVFDSRYDFSYRPETYWPNLPTEESTLAKVKGSVRRDVARSLLEQPDEIPPPDGVGEFLLSPNLGNEARTSWGGFHPAKLGGEFLPDAAEGEVEVARSELRSTTGDVYHVLAKRGEDGRIHYRAVDEYWDEGSRFAVSPDVSDEPITLGEVIDLIDSAEQTASDRLSGFDVGLFDMDRQFNYEESGTDPRNFVDFAAVRSAFYPKLAEYYVDRAEAWLIEAQEEFEEEFEEEAEADEAEAEAEEAGEE